VTAPESKPARRIPTGWAVRIAVSAVVLSVTLYLLPTQEVVGAVRRLSLTVWLVSLVIFLSGHVVSALKWRLLISEDGEVGIGPISRASWRTFACRAPPGVTSCAPGS
jgi:hypothetical protein